MPTNSAECALMASTNFSGRGGIVDGILDTGSPRTEFSDQFLLYAGCLKSRRENAIIPPGLQTLYQIGDGFGFHLLPGFGGVGGHMRRQERTFHR